MRINDQEYATLGDCEQWGVVSYYIANNNWQKRARQWL
jgi:hypothetical protein